MSADKHSRGCLFQRMHRDCREGVAQLLRVVFDHRPMVRHTISEIQPLTDETPTRGTLGLQDPSESGAWPSCLSALNPPTSPSPYVVWCVLSAQGFCPFCLSRQSSLGCWLWTRWTSASKFVLVFSLMLFLRHSFTSTSVSNTRQALRSPPKYQPVNNAYSFSLFNELHLDM